MYAAYLKLLPSPTLFSSLQTAFSFSDIWMGRLYNVADFLVSILGYCDSQLPTTQALRKPGIYFAQHVSRNWSGVGRKSSEQSSEWEWQKVTAHCRAGGHGVLSNYFAAHILLTDSAPVFMAAASSPDLSLLHWPWMVCMSYTVASNCTFPLLTGILCNICSLAL